MEKFFSLGGRYSEEELVDLIYSRYHSVEFMREMEPETLVRLIDLAEEKEEKKKHYLAWATQLPYMDSESYISFNDYHDRMTLKNVDFRPASEIEAEIELIEQKLGE